MQRSLTDPSASLNEAELAALRGMKIGSLRNERAARRGPPVLKFGRKVLYPRLELDTWLTSRITRPDGTPTLVHGHRNTRVAA